MSFPQVTIEDWRAQVDKELAGASFDKVLVHRAPEGLSVQPLYTERPDAEVGVDARGPVSRVCVRIDGAVTAERVKDEIDGGADALWLDAGASGAALEGVDAARVLLVLEAGAASPLVTLEMLAGRLAEDVAFALDADPVADVARGRLAASALDARLADLASAAQFARRRWPRASAVFASTLPYHDAGADAADEIAFALSTGAAYLDALIAGGFSPLEAAESIALRVAVGRDTFGELCKLRALRLVWRKVLAASGAGEARRPTVHAVCSSRTMARRDPWVNMLRVTSEVFAAVLGGADLVTPVPFDAALGAASPLGRRVARNTGLVLREESALGRVRDPAGGSYYFDSRTDALAREAWTRFQALEREGGIVQALASGALAARLDAAWAASLALLTTRRTAVLGVSEFANLEEKLPPAADAGGDAEHAGGLPAHRDAEPFEALRLRAEALSTPPTAILVALGPLAESRPRVGFASNFFRAGGIRVRETSEDEAAPLACLCGSDERYALEAVDRARALKAAGCRRVLLAGRPGPLEAKLREAGVDAFVYAGGDAVTLLSDLLDALR